ncbi:DUF2061 domain-containing protein [Paracidovorax sp. MALMAid1276]|uniref:DUF2061 domain-containing protein n=1 Tax=Paracidovorax sp. MALMAid1276 TaxID=3411631 RepID=UPI003B9B4836
MSRIRRTAHENKTMLMKTASYYVIHIAVAAMVAYAVTGNLWASLTLSLLEPTVQAVAFFFHEKAWSRVGRGTAGDNNASANAAPQGA